MAGTRKGHVRAKSMGDEVAMSHEGSRGCKWDLCLPHQHFLSLG